MFLINTLAEGGYIVMHLCFRKLILLSGSFFIMLLLGISYGFSVMLVLYTIITGLEA